MEPIIILNGEYIYIEPRVTRHDLFWVAISIGLVVIVLSPLFF
jgi:hypothetical protein